jgi:hypothetical protein
MGRAVYLAGFERWGMRLGEPSGWLEGWGMRLEEVLVWLQMQGTRLAASFVGLAGGVGFFDN